MDPILSPLNETEEQRRRRAEALAAARAGIPLRDSRPLPAVTITAPRAHPWVESMTRAQNPDLVAGQPPLEPQLTMRDLAADMAVQPFAASANMVTRFGEGAARTVGATKTADALRDRRQLINEITAPSTGMGLGTRVVSDLGASALPYIASGAGALGLIRSAGLTALESRSDDGSLVKGMADLTGSDALKRLADSPYRTPTDVGVDVAFNLIPGAKQTARTLMRGVPEATQGMTGTRRVVQSLRQVAGNAASEVKTAVRQNPGTALATAAAIAGDAVAPGAGTMLAAAAPVVGRPAFTETLYSRLGRAIDEAPFEKGTPQQWKALISKGVAAGEREFTGIEDFLNSSTAKTLTKQEVQQAFENGRIKLGEKMASDNLDMARDALDDRIAARRKAIEAQFNIEELGNRWNRANQDFDRASEYGARIALQEERAVKEAQDAWEEARRLRDRAMGADPELQELERERSNLRLTKFRQYTQPGLPENYREVVLTLDNRVASENADEMARLEAERTALFDRNDGSIASFTPEESARLDAINARMREIDPGKFGGNDPNIFRTRSHWEGIDNPLLHLRLTDRATAGGERTLFVEELQSDWHQQGRDRGYRPRDGSPPQYEGDLDRLVGADERVPDAPFKKTQEWVELGLKRALDEAVKGGYDRVAFVTGQQAADNFKLTRRVGTVYWNRSATDGAVDLIDAETGTPFAEAVPVGKLRGMLGDETAASKIQQAFEEGNLRGRLTDVNVKVGGEGMREFYDRIVPNTIKDYAKTLGVNIELEPTSMKNGSRNLSFRITPEVRERVSMGQRLMSPLLTAGSAAAAGGALGDEENRGQMALAAGLVGVTGRKVPVRPLLDIAADNGLGQAIRRMRLPQVTDEAAMAAQIPGRGLFSKPEEGVTKTSPLPSPSTVRSRLEDASRALRRLELTADEPWQPTERGVFDRAGFDPNYRMQSGTNTMPGVTGKADETLASLLDNKYLRDFMDRQVALGLRQGGEGFYNLQPVAASIDEVGGPFTFNDWVGASSAGSIQASLPLEMSNASIMLYARANNIPYEAARDELMQRYPQAASPWASRTHFQKFDEYLDQGAINPGGPASGARKVPYYFRQKLGESAPSMGPVVDTHESKAALYPVGAERYIDQLTGRQYEQIGDFYREGAARMGLPVETYQAGRWLGGGPLTGLKSPRGDYIQGLEDVLAWSAQQTGRGTDPASLRKYWADVVRGRDFILPYYGKGAPPVR